jgi:polyisoprenoid-binding protein YceI
LRFLLVLCAAFSCSAQAVEYVTLIPERSHILFSSKQMGVPVEGRFNKYSAEIAFDPAKPEAGRAQIEIDLAGTDAGSPDANDEVKTKGWFNLKEFPAARFNSESVRALGTNRYEAKGKLSIKGKTQDAIVPFTYKPEGANAVLEGGLTIRRTQFGVGDGPWADTSVVADEVPLKFRFTLAPKPAPK